jgi:ubiquinone/menaquinone biosynthesis C-methylase UbiE
VTLRHLQDLRHYELKQTLSLMPHRSRVLEVGAGAGWQAKTLAHEGFSVVAVDVPGTLYLNEREWPVLNYDGSNLPFPDGQFDVVFSSHVLEHVSDLENFQTEVKRVLKTSGTAIHVLPTATWRFWTSIAYYFFLATKVLELVLAGSGARKSAKMMSARVSNLRRNGTRALFPSRHGETGNVISELYLFSRFRWLALFYRTGWIVERYRPSGVFYTGYALLGSKLSIGLRRQASYLFGSSSHVFCLKKSLSDLQDACDATVASDLPT